MNDFKIEQRRRIYLSFQGHIPENRSMKLALLILAFIHSAFGAECSMRNMLAENAGLMPPDREIIEPVRGQGGFINPNYVAPPSSGGVVEMPSVRRSRLLGTVQPRPKAEAEQMIREIKDLMIQEITGEGELSPHQALMIKRVRDLQVNVTDCTGAEGSNDSSSYEISLCLNTLKMPKLALVSLVAHEIGHSLDLCGLGSKRYKKNDPNVNLESVNENLGGSQNLFLDTLGKMSNPGNSFLLDTSVTTTPEQQSQFQKIAAAAGLEVVDQGIPQHENPLAASYACLNGADPYYRPLPENRNTTCNDTLYTESGAQIWAARITGKFVSTYTPSKEEALGLFANVMAGMNKGTTNKEHDIDSIYFSDPNIRNMFGCSQKPKQNCLDQFRPAASRSLAGLINSVSGLGNDPVNVSCGSGNP